MLVINKSVCEFLSTATNNWKPWLERDAHSCIWNFSHTTTKIVFFWSHQSLFKVENTYDISKNN